MVRNVTKFIYFQKTRLILFVCIQLTGGRCRAAFVLFIPRELLEADSDYMKNILRTQNLKQKISAEKKVKERKINYQISTVSK